VSIVRLQSDKPSNPLFRSSGYGSLQVWIHHLRQGITFQKTYTAPDSCKKSGWKGSAIKIGGGYVWGEVYAIAAANNVIVVGGGDPVSSALRRRWTN
jgi:hypothetical protein